MVNFIMGVMATWVAELFLLGIYTYKIYGGKK